MARAKNTSRANARRRTRDLQRSELTGEDLVDDSVEAEDAVETAPEPRKPLFRMPDIRADIRALPQVFLSRRLMWVPLLLLAVGFVLTLVAPGLDQQIQNIALLFIQFFFVPPALFTFFIAGFVSPRASYLVGLMYGLLAGVLWSIVILVTNTDIATGEPAATPSVALGDPISVLSQMIVVGALYGTLAAAFAAWYRDFLRQMQSRGQDRRAAQEAKLRDQRRNERQEARKQAKRPTS